jgi:hypothetical protein
MKSGNNKQEPTVIHSIKLLLPVLLADTTEGLRFFNTDHILLYRCESNFAREKSHVGIGLFISCWVQYSWQILPKDGK